MSQFILQMKVTPKDTPALLHSKIELGVKW